MPGTEECVRRPGLGPAEPPAAECGKQRFLHLSRSGGPELESDHLGESMSGESGHLLGDTKGFS